MQRWATLEGLKSTINRKVKVTEPKWVLVSVLANVFVSFGGVTVSGTSCLTFKPAKHRDWLRYQIMQETVNCLFNLSPAPIFYRHSSFDKGYRVTIIKIHYRKALGRAVTRWGYDEKYLQLSRGQTVNRGCIQEWNTVLCHRKQAAQWHWWHVTSILWYFQALWSIGGHNWTNEQCKACNVTPQPTWRQLQTH